MIQKTTKDKLILEILRKFKENDKLKYNEIYEKNWCSTSHFDYYLKKIINEGLIVKEENNYVLSPKGIQHITEVDGKDISIKQKPVLCSFLLAINENGKFLINKRAKQPFLNYFNVPGGKVDLGESTKECAIREFKEEVGLDTKKPILKAINEKLTYNKKGDLIHHIIGYFYITRDFSGKLLEKTEEGENTWIEFEDFIKEKRFPELDYFIPKFLEENEDVLIKTIKRIEKNGEIISYEII